LKKIVSLLIEENEQVYNHGIRALEKSNPELLIFKSI